MPLYRELPDPAERSLTIRKAQLDLPTKKTHRPDRVLEGRPVEMVRVNIRIPHSRDLWTPTTNLDRATCTSGWA